MVRPVPTREPQSAVAIGHRRHAIDRIRVHEALVLLGGREQVAIPTYTHKYHPLARAQDLAGAVDSGKHAQELQWATRPLQPIPHERES